MFLSIDIESYSDVSLRDCGVYRYADDPSFEILLFAYAFDDEEVQLIDLAQGEKLPDIVVQAILDPHIKKSAFNAQFERVCLGKHLGKQLEPEGWYCTQVHSLMLGLPSGLDNVSKSLGFAEDKQKLFTGKNLIRLFSVPRKPTKASNFQTRYFPKDKPEEWQQFREYCIQDVVVEREIREKLQRYPVPEEEWKLYHIDQRINDFGVKLDFDFVESAIAIDIAYSTILAEQYKHLTGLENPKSVEQLKGWLSDRLGFEVNSVTKDTMPDLIGQAEEKGLDEVKQALGLRQEIAKTSVSKYKKMEKVIGSDGRARGLLQFYGANRTGRWAGRLIQVQNLPRNNIEDLDLARGIVKGGDLELLDLLYDQVPDILSQLIRTAFVPSDGHRFIVSDFSAIEARVIAWFAGEQWRLDVFETHGKIYEASAATMFNVPLESIDRGSPLRQKGKVAELACIAEGELVLTDRGLVPIENVTLKDKVWDGCNYVNHDGVIYKGVKEVIDYGGLKATKDHLVWIEGKRRPVRFEYAATSKACLLQSGSGRREIWIGRNYNGGKKMEEKLARSLRASEMCKLRKNTMDTFIQPKKGEIEGVPTVLAAKTDPEMVRSEIYSSKTKMHKPERWELQKLRVCASLFRFRTRCGFIYDRESRITWETYGVGQNRCGWSLRTRKLKMGDAPRKLSEPTKVYDILNCGLKNRFTVSNILVHNCGYQGSVGALIQMGALEMGLQEEELPTIIKQWRAANKKIVQFWYDVQNAAHKAIRERTTVELQKGLKFIYNPGVLFIQLPSGRRLSYIRPKIEPHHKFEGANKITYEGMGTGNRWVSLDTFGGKLVENIVQATARDCLREAIVRVHDAGYKIAFHVHDELVLDVPLDQGSLEDVNLLLGQSIDWAPGLTLTADGFICSYYVKD